MSTLKCGLIGEHLSHSYSPEIHKILADYEYKLYEMPENEVETFLKAKDYDALNVTIPYKKTVIPYLDVITESAKKIGSVNTIVKKDGKLYGYNTDYYGFSYMVEKSGIEINGKKVLVLGSGGASVTVTAVLRDKNASSVTVISRSGEDNYTNISKHSDAEVIVNTTPVGMYPHNGTSPVDLSFFPKLSGVLDLIYNPSKTSFILDAEERGIKSESGLIMLVAQAKLASELFTGSIIPDSVIGKAVEEIKKERENITLVGMPGVGKTTVGKLLSDILGRTFVDIDEEIEKKSEMKIPEIFKKYGEKYFRDIESECLREFSKGSSRIISTGGGAVVREENRRLIRQNSHVLFLDRDLSSLATDGRPISQSRDLSDIKKERLPYYLAVADVKIEVSSDVNTTLDKVRKALNI